MKTLDNISTQAHWFLRLAIASVFIYHGLLLVASITFVVYVLGWT